MRRLSGLSSTTSMRRPRERGPGDARRRGAGASGARDGAESTQSSARRGRRRAGQGEGAPGAEDGPDVDVAAEEPGEPAGDGQAEARAAAQPFLAAVDLAERREEHPELLGRDADAGVGHGVAEPRVAVGADLGREHQLDGPAVGELQRVAHEVHEDLLQAGRVGGDGARQTSLGADAQVEHALGRARAEERLDLREHAAGLDGLDARHDLPGLDAREVEDVVHERQQVLGVAAQVVAPLLLPVGALARSREQVRVPDDRRHRRADLVAHAREELALRAARGLRLLDATRSRTALPHARGRARSPRRAPEQDRHLLGTPGPARADGLERHDGVERARETARGARGGTRRRPP